MTDITITQPTIDLTIAVSTGPDLVISVVGQPVVEITTIGIQGPPGDGGGGGGMLIASAVGGTANAITLTVPDLVLGADPVAVWFEPAFANGAGGVTVAINGGAPVALVSRAGTPLIAEELIATFPVLIKASTAGAKILTGTN